MGAGRTIVVGDIHGDRAALERLLGRLPALRAEDTLLFLGDYVDRGPDSAGVVRFLRQTLPRRTPARLVCLRGNHEDGWLQVIDHGYPEFIFPPGNGCRATMDSYEGVAPGKEAAGWLERLFAGAFFPPEDVAWMRALVLWHEDEHAIYVHAGLPRVDGRWLHPREVDPPRPLLWDRLPDFFRHYDGKLVVCGHTSTAALPPEMSSYTPDDPRDLWVGPHVIGADTACGRGGFLSAVELPARTVYESR